MKLTTFKDGAVHSEYIVGSPTDALKLIGAEVAAGATEWEFTENDERRGTSPLPIKHAMPVVGDRE